MKNEQTNTAPTGKLGPRRPASVPSNAVWISSNQVLARYGGRSQMWLWRKVNNDPRFPKPTYFGRLQFFKLAALEAYEQGLVVNDGVA